MTKLMKNYRYWVVGILGCVGLLIMISIPEGLSTKKFLEHLILQETIGGCILIIATYLYVWWHDNGKLSLHVDE